MFEALPALLRNVTAGRRLLVVGGVGIVAGAVAAPFAPWQLAVLAGWDAAAASEVGLVWMSVGRLDANETRAFATREDDSRVSAQLLLLFASVVSLFGVGLDLAKASVSSGDERVALTVVGVLTVVLSWAVVHTVFALRYAHEYYTRPIGGIDFKNDEAPDYQDFGYVAFTIGMTFQVSDTDVQARTIRRTILRHALLSYLFGAVIVAVTVNVIATLL